MSPITHLLLSWVAADELRLGGRDRAVVTIAGVLPDLDGVVPLAFDVANRLLGRPDCWYYGTLHHWLLHGLPAALLLTLLAWAVASRRWTAAVTFAVIHLHLLCDLVGARGPGPDDIWPIYYLAPLSADPELAWSGQWKLNAWPNILLTIALLALVFVRAVERGDSPLGLLSRRADAAFVATLRNRFRRSPPA